ncbi:trypsin-like peptidase domain-containing protein [Paraburkholderia phenazinium]|uniref:Probable periplasmic serine endoprotease DegP-like n=1 Tax=Paraburkholderia phenazinium TaxID=60549 RepID=A0A1G8C5P6_9BURK|nr:trypsin-like peptidase domain-containing protein [Paraburkholderia phenazinium]SDH40240.1 serine protease Do [Paraburkholderia phenazinium]
MKIRDLKRVLVVECMVAALCVGCTAHATAFPPTPQSLPSGVTPNTLSVPATGISDDFARLVRLDGPAVVHISASGAKRTARLAPLWPPAGDQADPFYRFFQQFSPGDGGSPELGSENVGSGFIISPDGYILTDAHVVDGATQIHVKLTDRREFKATLVGLDPASDIALLKIDARQLPTVKIGTSSLAKAGQWVVSIGSPYGFENTAAAGIISDMNRFLPSETYIPLIQTDMTNSTGDDGSPLFNLDGEVIGIEAPVHPTHGIFEGLAFEIPIDAAMKVEQQLQHHMKVEHGRLGVTIQEVTGPLAQSFGLPKPVGALISSVDQHGPSAKADLRSGDVILKLNDLQIDDSAQLPMAVADLQPGTKVHIEFWRDQSPHDTEVVLGTLNTAALASASADQSSVGPDGLTVRGLTPQERDAAGVREGVRVEQSVGPAAMSGIQPGDIILMVNNVRVSSVAQFRQRIERSGKSVALLVEHDGHQMFVTIDVS